MGSFVNKTQRAGSMLRAQGFVELSNDCWDAADYISRLEAVVRAMAKREVSKSRKLPLSDTSAHDAETVRKVLSVAVDTLLSDKQARANILAILNRPAKKGSKK